MSVAYIGGLNTPKSAVACGTNALYAVGNGVVTHNSTGKCTFWVPFSGDYRVENLAYCEKTNHLFVIERKLDLSISVFDSASKKKLFTSDPVGQSQVEDLIVSEDGTALLVLASNPTPQAILFHVASTGQLQQRFVLKLGVGRMSSISFRKQHNGSFVACGEGGLCLATYGAANIPNLVSQPLPHSVIHCTLWTANGVFCGGRRGQVMRYDHTTFFVHEYAQLQTTGDVLSIEEMAGELFFGTSSGEVFLLSQTHSPIVRLSAAVHRIIQHDGPTPGLLLGCANGLLRWDREADPNAARTLQYQLTGDLCGVFALPGNGMVLVSKTGELLLLRVAEEMAVVHNCWYTVTDACLSGDVLWLLSSGGSLHAFRCTDASFQFLALHKWAECSNGLACAVDQNRLVVLTEHEVWFGSIESSYELRLTARTKLRVLSSLSKILFLPDQEELLLSSQAGEVYLLRFPENTDDVVEVTAELLVSNVWMLDFPARDLAVVYSGPDTVNIMVHSVDRDTKLYALERRKEVDAKLLRPLFLMKDHEGGGTVLRRLSPTTMVSAGKDGTVFVRDVAHYQAKLTSIPPSKEKSKPLYAKKLLPHYGNGVTLMCVGENCVLVGGKGGVFVFLPLTDSISFSWSGIHWHHGTASSPLRKNYLTASPCVEECSEATMKERQELVVELGKIQEELEEALNDEDLTIPAESLLIPTQRVAFSHECEEHVARMQKEMRYGKLRNEFLQEKLKRTCWDVMEVQRTKIVGLRAAGVEVHNFHLRKESAGCISCTQKVSFMRRLQREVAVGFSFSSGEGAIYTPKKTLDATATEGMLYPAYDVYTPLRARLQATLLKERVRQLKHEFNSKYDSLRERKQRELANTKERNLRCLKIMKKLGGAVLGPLFEPICDREEDPEFLFVVENSELSSEARHLLGRNDGTDHQELTAHDAAVKRWMDGLEKDAEELKVDVQLPSFCDVQSEQFVPPDERTDEQQREGEMYEKLLEEQTAYVEQRKEELRTEFAALQKLNDASAGEFDQELLELRKHRMEVVQRIDEAELQQVTLLAHQRRLSSVRLEVQQMQQLEEDVNAKCQHIQFLLDHKKADLSSLEENLESLVEQEKNFGVGARQLSPFTNEEWGERLYKRFLKWKNKPHISVERAASRGRHDGMPSELNEQYKQVCETVLRLRNSIAVREQEVAISSQAVSELQSMHHSLQNSASALVNKQEQKKQGIFRNLLNFRGVFHLRQEQVQDETAFLASDFEHSCLRQVSEVNRYNALVLESSNVHLGLLRKITERSKKMKHGRWEIQRLNYSIGMRELEFRQLHTLRVTRQMQEALCGNHPPGITESMEKARTHRDLVTGEMNQRLVDKQLQMSKFRRQIADRRWENKFLEERLSGLAGVVQQRQTVHSMLHGQTSEHERLSTRMRELYEYSELEEVAKSQQEELVRLKAEIDRLRERTFPSFAVVAKRQV